ncbi:hypothetical protein FNYG_06079 [Fusarium nygamai]|uniref:Uncharacterized protein n=1 Tax=Gibberella nygamai TaxID=42673 RepID=A0A2K0WDX8_GIBNY|nr:hypothetical protein FNYG_06079 [Fusarium nygamai]
MQTKAYKDWGQHQFEADKAEWKYWASCFKTLGFATHQTVSDFTHGSLGEDYIHHVIYDPNLEGHDHNYEGEISYYLCQDAFITSDYLLLP